MFSRATKFTQDLAWNYCSLIAMIISGLAINFSIGYFYSSSGLGVFNQVFAVYSICSHIAAFGIHFSVLKYIAEYKESEKDRKDILMSALWLSLGCSLLFLLLISLILPFTSFLLESPDVTQGLRYGLFGLIFFTVNKVFLGYLNGLRMIKAFSIFQILRYTLMLTYTVIGIYHQFDISTVCLVFLVSEGILFVFLTGFFGFTQKLHLKFTFHKGWIEKHFNFGLKSFTGGLLFDAINRIDIIFLGVFLDDAKVGIYSFAKVLLDGIYNFLIVIRNNVNPLLVQIVKESNFDTLRQTQKALFKWVYPGFAIMAVGLALVYPIFIASVPTLETFAQSYQYLLVLLIFMGAVSAFIPLDQILLQSGHPETYSKYILGVLLFGSVLNVILIPNLGIYGAALASSATYVFNIVLLGLYVRRKLGYNIFTELLVSRPKDPR